MKSQPKKQQNTVKPKAAATVVLPKPNQGEAIHLGLLPSFSSHSHTKPKRSA